MATRIRDGVPGKEKSRVSTNPSPAPSKPIGSKPKPPSSSSSPSPSTDKDIPNYLKPIKSRTGVDQPTQKTASTVASENALLARRRSFGKNPPPASQSPRTQQSLSLKEKSLRASSSFSGSKSATTDPLKGAPNRILKTAAATKDVVKKPSLYARSTSTKKSNNVTPKKSCQSSAAASKASSIISSPERVEDIEIVDAPQLQEDDRQSSLTEVPEVPINGFSSHATNEQVSIDSFSDYEAIADVVKEEEEQKTETPVQAKPDIHEQEDIKIIASPRPELDNQKTADQGSMKAEDVKDQNKADNVTSSIHLESQQPQEQLEDKTTTVNDNLEIKGKEEVKDAAEVIKEKRGVKKEEQVVNLRKTEEVKNIASTKPLSEIERKLEKEQKHEEEPLPAPVDTKTVASTKPSSEIERKPEKEQKHEEEPLPALEETKTVASKPAPAPEETQSVAPKSALAPGETQTVASKPTHAPEEIQSVAAKQVSAPEDTKPVPAPEDTKPVPAPEETQTVAAKPAPAPAPKETQSVEAKRPTPSTVQGKKETSAVSNDAIEETASKLQEQRRNRVRALAGAFETVIARQDK